VVAPNWFRTNRITAQTPIGGGIVIGPQTGMAIGIEETIPAVVLRYPGIGIAVAMSADSATRTAQCLMEAVAAMQAKGLA